MGIIRMLKRKFSKKKKYSIEDIKLENNHINMIEKKSVKIVFVDDEGYDIETFKGLGYKDIDKMYEYKDLSDFQKYDVIFCDVNGIATNLDPVFQGAELAKQIKLLYPNKMVVIYSSKNQVINIAEYSKYVDHMIEKNTKPVIIADYINEYIEKINNPKTVWYDLKDKMKKMGIDNNTLNVIENYYAKSVIEGKNCSLELQEELVPLKMNIGISDIITIVSAAIEIYLSTKGV